MIVTTESPISIDRETLSGVPVFVGTRVPVSALLQNIEAGVSLEEFFENFPTVTREQVDLVLTANEFHHDLAIANKVMKKDREVLGRLSRS